MSVYFHQLYALASIPQKTKLKSFIEALFVFEKRKLFTLNYIFTSDDYLLSLNKQFLKHHTLTDIITFDLSENIVEEGIIGEIYISVDRVKENAVKYKTSKHYELHRVIFHGALHLCGHKDKTNEEKLKMRELENYFLTQYLGKHFT